MRSAPRMLSALIGAVAPYWASLAPSLIKYQTKGEEMKKLIVFMVGMFAATCSLGADPVRPDGKFAYTLYRSSPLLGGEKQRIHVATFDAMAGREYNRDNCEIAKKLFQDQPGVKVTYWCERGYFSEN